MPLGTDAQPAGRYRFYNESPLTRLDVSFHDPVAFDRLMASGEHQGQPVGVRVLWTAAAHETPTSYGDVTPACPRAIDEAEQIFGEYMYRIVRAIKYALRGHSFRWPMSDCIAGLEQVMHGMNGGASYRREACRLARSCLSMARSLQCLVPGEC